MVATNKFVYHLYPHTDDAGHEQLLEHEVDLEEVAARLEEHEERPQVRDADEVHVAGPDDLAVLPRDRC